MVEKCSKAVLAFGDGPEILFGFFSLTGQGTLPGVNSLSNQDFAYLIDLDELCLP